jgi:hypothetical protein
MTFFADGEDLAEGDVEDALREMAPALHRFGVELRVHTVSDNNSAGGDTSHPRSQFRSSEPDPCT